MININNYIVEKLTINRNISKQYTYHPQDNGEFFNLVEKLLKERGNDADLNDIDTSKVTHMNELFDIIETNNPSIRIDNIDISEWNVSHVTDMRGMFYNCHNFNCNLSKWDVSHVTDMNRMFYNCHYFNCNLSNWDVSSVIDMDRMFYGCSKFTGEELDRWNTNSLKDIDQTFNYCTSLKKIPNWYHE